MRGDRSVVERVVVGEQDDHVGRRDLLAVGSTRYQAAVDREALDDVRVGRADLGAESTSSWATRTAGDSRASPVFFLYARPSSRIREPLTERCWRLSASMSGAPRSRACGC